MLMPEIFNRGIDTKSTLSDAGWGKRKVCEERGGDIMQGRTCFALQNAIPTAHLGVGFEGENHPTMGVSAIP